MGSSRARGLGGILGAVLSVGHLSVPPIARAETQVSLNLNLSMSGMLGDSPFTTGFSINESGRLSVPHLSVAGSFFRADAGELSTNWDSLGFTQRNFRGLAVAVPSGKVETTLIGGAVVGTDRRGEQTFSPLYGVRVALPLARSMRLSASQLFSARGADKDGGQGAITSLALEFQPSVRRRLSLELARGGAGTGWQLSGEASGKRWDAHACYRQTQKGFSSAGNPLLERGRNGGLMSLRLRLAQPLTLSLSSQRYSGSSKRGSENALGFGPPGIDTSNSDQIQLRLAPKGKPSLSLYWRSRATTTQFEAREWGGEDTLAGTRRREARNVGLRLSHRIKSTRLSLQYDHLRFNDSKPLPGLDPQDGATAGTTQRLSLGLSHRLSRSTSFSWNQVVALNTRSQGESQRTLYTLASATRRLGRSGASILVGLDHQTVGGGEPGQALGARAGVSLPVGDSSSLNLEYRASLGASGLLRSRGNNTIYATYSQHFRTGRARTVRGGQSLQELRKLGSISGRIFEDKNGNGRWEEGEPGISDVALRSMGREQQTGADGRFTLANLQAGPGKLEMIVKTLPIDYSPLTDTTLPVAVPEGKTATINIPVVRTGQVQGVVFLDANRNNRQDNEEKGLSNAIVRVENSDIISFTDAQGRFTLHNLAPRSWRVLADTSMTGAEYISTGVRAVEVQVLPGASVEGVALGLAPPERTIISTFKKKS